MSRSTLRRNSLRNSLRFAGAAALLATADACAPSAGASGRPANAASAAPTPGVSSATAAVTSPASSPGTPAASTPVPPASMTITQIPKDL
jgi:hypothetical protein